MERQKYSQEFKEQAVRLSQVSDKSVVQVARELGIHTNMLYRWRREASETQNGKRASTPPRKPPSIGLPRTPRALYRSN